MERSGDIKMSKEGIISITMIAVVAIILLTAVFLGNFNKNIVTEKAESRFVEIYSSPAYNTSETGFKIYYDIIIINPQK